MKANLGLVRLIFLSYLFNNGEREVLLSPWIAE